MRIAITHAFSWPEVRRGGERLVGELSGALADLGHQVTVMSSAYETGRVRRGNLTEVRFRRRRAGTMAAEADFGVRVLPALVAGRYDVVHTHGRRDGVASIRAARLHPGRGTVHTDIGLPSREWWETMGKEAGYAARVIRDVDVYACMSEYALDVLQADYGRTGTLIPGGVDTATFAPGPSRTPTPTILFSGAFDEPRKGVSTLLAALPLIAREEPGVRLQLSGSGDAGTLLREAPPEARDRTDVLGAGSLDDQPGRYARAWVNALPSIGDTFGLTLIESLACGTPVVAAANAALPELVAPGVTGALSTYDDVESLARACLEAIALARTAGTTDACRAAALPFDWRTGVAPRAIAAYETALARH